MQELKGNLWELANWPDHKELKKIICITTNGSIRKDGSAVTGRGCALEASNIYQRFPMQLGYRLKHIGNQLHYFSDFGILSFPVKHEWNQQASLTLIDLSVKQLLGFSEIMAEFTFLLPRPGCGNGNRTWHEIKPLVSRLPDNVFIVSYNWEG